MYERGDDEGPAMEKIARLVETIFTALDEHSEREKFNTGEAMSALFSVFVASATASPNYDPSELVRQTDARIREAVGLQ